MFDHRFLKAVTVLNQRIVAVCLLFWKDIKMLPSKIEMYEKNDTRSRSIVRCWTIYHRCWQDTDCFKHV